MSKYLKILLFSLMAFMGCEDAVEGEDGLPILVSVVDEPAGSNCANSGSKVSFGYDNNANGTLDATEVTNATFICDGTDGQDGNDGTDGQDGNDGDDGVDGSANVDVQIVQWTSSNTMFNEDDSPNENDGNVYAVFTNSSLTQNVLQNGFIKVEMATSMGGPWFQLPYVFYDETTDDISFIYDAWYSYGQGAVTINWNCSFGRTLSEWQAISSLYQAYYKITTIVE